MAVLLQGQPGAKHILALGKNGDELGLTQWQATRLMNDLGLRGLHNGGFDRRLVITDKWEGEKGVYPAWNMLVAYEKPGAPFRETIASEFSNGETILAVPQRLIGKKDVLIAVPHDIAESGAPSFQILQEGDRQAIHIIDEGMVFTYRCPGESGWRKMEEQFSLPVGKESSVDGLGTRFFSRADNAAYAGLLSRGVDAADDISYNIRRIIDASFEPSLRFGALAAVPKWAEKNLREFAEQALSALAQISYIADGQKNFIREQLEMLKAA